jgi:aldehyde dehydrogenase (NAD+)
MFSFKVAPALATGCTVVIKPSELTPLSAMYMTKLLKEAGLPAGVVNVVVGYGPTVGNALTINPRVDKVAFTGSTAVGRKVMEAASKSNLKSVTLELGGKSADIVFEDANFNEAVKYAAHGIFFNHGQNCVRGVWDRMGSRLTLDSAQAHACSFNVGSTMNLRGSSPRSPERSRSGEYYIVGGW